MGFSQGTYPVAHAWPAEEEAAHDIGALRVGVALVVVLELVHPLRPESGGTRWQGGHEDM